MVSRSVEFFACASRCALQPLHRGVERTVGVCVLSAPAGFRTSNPRLGFHHGTRNAQDPPKPTGWYVRGRQIRLRASSSSSSSACYLIPLPFFFHPRFLLLLLVLLHLFLTLLFFRPFPFFSLPTQLSDLFHYGAPMCPDVAVTFFSLLVLMLKLSRWHRATCFTTIFLFYFIFFIKYEYCRFMSCQLREY